MKAQGAVAFAVFIEKIEVIAGHRWPLFSRGGASNTCFSSCLLAWSNPSKIFDAPISTPRQFAAGGRFRYGAARCAWMGLAVARGRPVCTGVDAGMRVMAPVL
jgi:hypothetical protein